ncbi:MAG: hypothetical protein IT436_07495 [Phycisphaerales bacterium]|nr:hypothetical protein [Phycisphaerales bacterium]
MNRALAATLPVWLAGLVIALLPVSALSQLAAQWPGGSSMADGPELTHAWIAIPASKSADGKDQSGYLVHIPSRRGPPLASSGSKPASGGALRVAMRLRESPSALAAVDNRVYLVFENAPADGSPAIRQVLSMAAVPAGIGDLWSFDPADRLITMAPLPPGGRIAGFTGSPRGPVAMIDRGPDAPPPRFELLLLDTAGWRPVALPEAAGSPGEPSQLIAIRGGIAVVLSNADGPVGAWTGDWPAALNRPDPVWKFQPFGLANPDGAGPIHQVLQTGGVWVALQSDPAGLRLFTLEGGRWFPLTDVGAVPPDHAVVPLDDAALVAVMWKHPADAAATASSKPAESNFEMREISPWTGRVVYAGPARAKGPISWSDFRLLSLVLLGVMTLVLLIVVRTEPGGAPPVLPEGVSLAEPGHRWAAALVDMVVCGSAALWFWDVPLREVVNPAWMISARGEWALLTWVGLGFGLCTLTEAWFGLSPGKALTGAAVVSVRPDAQLRGKGIGLKAAALRNAIKWMLPPVGAIGVLSPDSRHFGDVIAGTAVVVRTDDAGTGPE